MIWPISTHTCMPWAYLVMASMHKIQPCTKNISLKKVRKKDTKVMGKAQIRSCRYWL